MRLWQAALAVPVFVGVAVVSGYLVRGRSDDKRGAIRVDGRERTYSLHVPAEYDGTEAVPLAAGFMGGLARASGKKGWLIWINRATNMISWWSIPMVWTAAGLMDAAARPRTATKWTT